MGAGRLTPPPLALYVHVPWCVRKCPYCDFHSLPLEGDVPSANYRDALLRDLDAEAPDRPLVSVFFGGGTPSLLPAGVVDDLLRELRARALIDADTEITLEANPGAVEHGRFAELRAAGVNRLSLGVQSFDDGQLQTLGRVHSAHEAEAAFAEARAAGFARINLDLMFGLPGQDMDALRMDLARALALAPEHLSWYQLTLESGTAFHRSPPAGLPDDELQWEMQALGREILAAAGYSQYEVSAYARCGQECRHNRNYWEFGDYIGIGAGAHGKRTRVQDGVIERCWKHRSPAAYMASRDRVAGRERLTEANAALEFFMNALRLTEGVAVDLFEARTGLPWSRVEAAVAEGVERGWLALAGGRVRTTRQGARFLDSLLQVFVP